MVPASARACCARQGPSAPAERAERPHIGAPRSADQDATAEALTRIVAILGRKSGRGGTAVSGQPGHGRPASGHAQAQGGCRGQHRSRDSRRIRRIFESARKPWHWAAHEARERGVMLTVCHAWAPGDAGPPLGPGEDPARESAQWILSAAVPNPDPARVRHVLVEGPVARALCEQSADADMLVVGSRSLEGLSGLLLGSVSLQVAARAPTPWSSCAGTGARPAAMFPGMSSWESTALRRQKPRCASPAPRLRCTGCR